jgi:hypothetical protein
LAAAIFVLIVSGVLYAHMHRNPAETSISQSTSTPVTSTFLANTQPVLPNFNEAEYKLALLKARKDNDYKAWESLQIERSNYLLKAMRSLDSVREAANIKALNDEFDSIVADINKYRTYGGRFTQPKKSSTNTPSSAPLTILPTPRPTETPKPTTNPTPLPCNEYLKASKLHEEDLAYSNFQSAAKSAYNQQIAQISSSYSGSPNAFQSSQATSTQHALEEYQENLKRGEEMHESRITTINATCYR